MPNIVGYCRIVPIVGAHLEYKAVAIAVCRRRPSLTSFESIVEPSRCSRVVSAPLPSSYFQDIIAVASAVCRHRQWLPSLSRS